VVVGCEFGMNVETLNCVHVGSFFVVLQYLHNVVYGAKRMCPFIKVLCEARCVAIVLEGLFVLVILYIEASSGLSYIRLFAFWAGEFVHSW
jgi:hypothetical protein